MKTLKTIALVLFGVLISTAGYAQQVPKKVVVGPPKVDKFQARKVLHRTSIVIYYAHKQVKASKNYTGDLAKAIGHQKHARKLYLQGKYYRAIHHSRVARAFAVKAIKANKAKEIEECKFTPEEEELLKNGPNDQDLS
jgi:superfamily II RNA helicase